MVVQARPDVIDAVVTHLRSFTEITALTATRITARLQPSWTGMPTYAVIVRPAGGPPASPTLPILITRIDVHCYGATEAEAAALWRQTDAIFCPSQERSSGFTVDDCRVYSVVRESMPISGIEPDSRWPRSTATYLVAWCGVAA